MPYWVERTIPVGESLRLFLGFPPQKGRFRTRRNRIKADGDYAGSS